MLSRTSTLRALLRQHPSNISQASKRSFSRLQPRAPTPPAARPNLTLTYRALPLHLQAAVPSPLQLSTTRPNSTVATPSPAPSPTQWTHFTTSYSYSSIRRFNSSHTNQISAATPEAATQATDHEAAQRIEEVIEEIQELYGTARDEFEIATEETEKNSTYAPDDRIAAREELDKLLEYYNGILAGGDRAVAEEVKRRVGGRIRELEQALLALEEEAAHGD